MKFRCNISWSGWVSLFVSSPPLTHGRNFLVRWPCDRGGNTINFCLGLPCRPGLLRGLNMNTKLTTLFAALILLLCAPPVRSHDVVGVNGQPITTHSHVWRQQQYGTDYRQGHSVSNSQGSITIWSPNTYKAYNAGSSVRFAKPNAYLKQSVLTDHTPNLKSASRSTHETSRTRSKD